MCAKPKTRLITEAESEQFLNSGGLWQWRQLLLVFCSYIPSALTSFSIVFIGFQPKFYCKDWLEDVNYLNVTREDSVEDVCELRNTTTNTTVGCSSGFTYSVTKDESIVSEFNLICGSAYLPEISQLLYTVGMASGSMIAGQISDHFGRRITFLCARVGCMACSVGLIFSPSITVFIVLRFAMGVLEMSTNLVRGVYITELTPLKYRALTTSLAGTTWGLSVCLEAFVGYLLKGHNWRIFQAAITGFFVTIFLDFIFLKESLSWLYANGKTEEASIILISAYKTNEKEAKELLLEKDICKKSNVLSSSSDFKETSRKTEAYSEDNNEHTLCLESQVPKTQDSSKRKITPIEVLKNKTLRNLILVISFIWFVNSLVYYGLFLMSSAMVGDRVLNFFIIAVVEIPACSSLYFILRYLKRRTVLILCHIVCAVSLLLAGVFNFTLGDPERILAMHIVTFIGKLGITASFLMLFFFTTEILPTNFRTSGLGIASFAARIGTFLSPFASVLLRILPWGPGIIFGSFCLVASVLLLMVPDTTDTELPQTLEDVQASTTRGQYIKMN